MTLPDAWPAFQLGLIGAGIGASLTPAMQEREGAEQALRLIYRKIDLDELGLDGSALPGLLLAAERMGFTGLNITYPCKQSVIPFLDELSEEARALGAVNTVLFRNGKKIGHNTDWSGFAAAFRRDLPDVALGRVVLLGAGGAGAAVAYALLTLGVQRLMIFDVDAEKTAAVIHTLAAKFGKGRAFAADDLAQEIPTADGVVNATPIGMLKLPGMPVAVELLRAQHWVADVIYFPLETAWLRAAQALGCRGMGGGGMAVFQAVDAFALFTGRPGNTLRMQQHFETLISPVANAD
ncbi:MAG: shikimate dehydrogenase [Roseomonas sp.]|nr:shikimate dehydrogenase [Roseomonas sp.]